MARAPTTIQEPALAPNLTSHNLPSPLPLSFPLAQTTHTARTAHLSLCDPLSVHIASSVLISVLHDGVTIANPSGATCSCPACPSSAALPTYTLSSEHRRDIMMTGRSQKGNSDVLSIQSLACIDQHLQPSRDKLACAAMRWSPENGLRYEHDDRGR